MVLSINIVCSTINNNDLVFNKIIKTKNKLNIKCFDLKIENLRKNISKIRENIKYLTKNYIQKQNIAYFKNLLNKQSKQNSNYSNSLKSCINEYNFLSDYLIKTSEIINKIEKEINEDFLQNITELFHLNSLNNLINEIEILDNSKKKFKILINPESLEIYNNQIQEKDYEIFNNDIKDSDDIDIEGKINKTFIRIDVLINQTNQILNEFIIYKPLQKTFIDKTLFIGRDKKKSNFLLTKRIYKKKKIKRKKIDKNKESDCTNLQLVKQTSLNSVSSFSLSSSKDSDSNKYNSYIDQYPSNKQYSFNNNFINQNVFNIKFNKSNCSNINLQINQFNYFHFIPKNNIEVNQNYNKKTTYDFDMTQENNLVIQKQISNTLSCNSLTEEQIRQTQIEQDINHLFNQKDSKSDFELYNSENF